MRSASRLIPVLETGTRSASSTSTPRHFVCQSCKAKLRRSLVTPCAPPIQRRAFAQTASSRAESPIAEEIPETKYEAAQTWDGLEWIGSKDWLYARDSRRADHERYGKPVIQHSSFAETFRLGLRRAVIETVALDTAGINAEKKEEILRAIQDKVFSMKGIGVRRSKQNGKLGLVFRDEGARLRLGTQLGVKCEGPVEQWWWTSWESVPVLADPEQKFTIAKRVALLTGRTLPDAAFSQAYTVRDVLAKLPKFSETKNVLQTLASDKELKSLNNITVYSKRQSYVDDDKAKGRWKVIEQELTDRGLPLPKGKAWARDLREKKALGGLV